MQTPIARRRISTPRTPEVTGRPLWMIASTGTLLQPRPGQPLERAGLRFPERQPASQHPDLESGIRK